MFSQEGRLLQLSTPLGADVLQLEGFEGREAFSEPFEYRLDLISTEAGIAAADIVGKGVAFQLVGQEEVLRTFHGFVRRFSRGGLHSSGLRRYQAVVVPWTWFLGKRSNCRIFQEKTVVEIVTQVLEDAGLGDFETSQVTGTYPTLEYCVQYNETDLDFVSRLLEEEGIAYHFRHEESRHVLVLSDGHHVYEDCAQAEVDYDEGTLAQDHVSSWSHRYEFVSGKWSHTDYDFTKPRVSLHADTPTVVDLPGLAAYERYEYPGRHQEQAHGGAKSKALMEAEEAGHEVVEGSSTCHSFQVAGKFRMRNHAFDSEAGTGWVVTEIHHSARDESYTQGGGGGTQYGNSFTAIPDQVGFRPARRTPRPRIAGPQTAVVVGPDGEEIHTDEYGRVKVQFHWDRIGESNEKSSCWVRVAQVWAGRKWGFQFLPRIGHEVVVDFLEGNPDRPLVTGSVFNADNMPLYDLPGQKTQSGIKTRSTKEGGAEAFNELRFEDKKGEEHIFLHAQKDEHHRVVNDYHEHVGNDWHRIVVATSRERVEGDHHGTVVGDRFEKVEGSLSLDVGADRKEHVAGAASLAVDGDLNASVGGDHGLDVTGALKAAAGGNASLDAGQDMALKGGMNLAAEAGMEMHLKGGMNVIVEAGMQLTLKAGSSFVTIGPAGVDISGPMVKMNSGGSAGSGGGCSPEAPAAPVDPDAPEDPVEPMEKAAAAAGSAQAPAPVEGQAGEVEFTSPQAVALAGASESGAAFCPL